MRVGVGVEVRVEVRVGDRVGVSVVYDLTNLATSNRFLSTTSFTKIENYLF